MVTTGRQAGVEAGNKSAWNPSAQCMYRNTNIALQLCIHTPDFPETAFPTFVENGFVSCPPNFHRQQELPLLVSTNWENAYQPDWQAVRMCVRFVFHYDHVHLHDSCLLYGGSCWALQATWVGHNLKHLQGQQVRWNWTHTPGTIHLDKAKIQMTLAICWGQANLFLALYWQLVS